jgi:hypothetical protein
MWLAVVRPRARLRITCRASCNLALPSPVQSANSFGLRMMLGLNE